VDENPSKALGQIGSDTVTSASKVNQDICQKGILRDIFGLLVEARRTRASRCRRYQGDGVPVPVVVSLEADKLEEMDSSEDLRGSSVARIEQGRGRG
jgi:hypothetical protein